MNSDTSVRLKRVTGRIMVLAAWMLGRADQHAGGFLAQVDFMEEARRGFREEHGEALGDPIVEIIAECIERLTAWQQQATLFTIGHLAALEPTKGGGALHSSLIGILARDDSLQRPNAGQ